MSGKFQLASVLTLLLIVTAAMAQRPRTLNQDGSNAATSQPTTTPAPQTVKAKYEGGVFGYRHKMEGTLNFDDTNQRLLFRNEKQKEILFLPYNSITGAFADTHAVRPAAATVASVIPYGFPAGFIKTKVRYLTVQYSDPDSKVSGVTSFKLENKQVLDSVLSTLAGKAELTKRGEVFIKKRP